MVKAARRFRYRGMIAADPIQLADSAARKARAVLRLAPGDHVAVLDDSGADVECEVIELGPPLVVAPLRKIPAAAAMVPASLGLAVIKGERMDWAVEKICELGIRTLAPLVTERCQLRDVSAARLDRWRRIAAAAALQSLHGRETEILEPSRDLASLMAAGKEVWHLEQNGIPFKQLLTGEAAKPEILLIGPEGGWSEQERAYLNDNSTAVSIGNGIARSETAAIIGSFVLSLFVSNH